MKPTELRKLIREEVRKVLKENEDSDLNLIVQKLKPRWGDVSIKDDKVWLKTYYANGNQKNWYTIEKVGDDMYSFGRGGRQLRDWSFDELIDNLVHNKNLSL
jgi:hypothetical protein